MLNNLPFSKVQSQGMKDPESPPKMLTLTDSSRKTVGFKEAAFNALPSEQDKDNVALSLLFQYSLLNKKMDDVNNSFSVQNQQSGGEPLSDKRFLEFITKSIKVHDPELVSKI
mmetsp:Transcript_37198/g.57109  ORF Transcript_37198/g.57109 Transcript_37198/m.57109 type:complete len:113 (-) Transcript_37198:443-781(-)